MSASVKGTWAALLTLLAVCALVALASGCAPGITGAYQVVGRVADFHKRGSELFDTFDKGQQEKILKAAKDRKDPDGGEGALKAYFVHQGRMLVVFEKAAGTVLAAEASLPLIKLGIEKKKTPGVWIATLLGQLSEMAAALIALGVPGLDALAGVK